MPDQTLYCEVVRYTQHQHCIPEISRDTKYMKLAESPPGFNPKLSELQ